MNKFRYNDPVERMKRVNRVYLIAIILLFGVLIAYQSLLVKAGIFPISLASSSRIIMLLALLIDGIFVLHIKYRRQLLGNGVCRRFGCICFVL